MDIAVNPIKGLSVLPAFLLNKKIEQYEITGDGRMINRIWYFIPEETSLENAKNEFKN